METPNTLIQATILPNPAKKPFYKKRWFYIPSAVLIVLIAISAYFGLKPNNAQFVTAEVKRGNIEQTVEATGELATLKRVDLTFQTNGVIGERFYNVGDSIEVGDVILDLLSGEAGADLLQAQEQVNKAQAGIDKLLSGASSTQKAISQADLDSAELDLENTKTIYQSAIDSALIAKQTAQDSYDSQLLSNDEEVVQLYEDLHSIIRGGVVQIRSAISDADEILGIENSLANQDFEKYLSQNNPQALSSAKNAFSFASEYRDLAESEVYLLDADSTYEEILDVAAAVSTALDYTAQTLMYVRQVLDGTVIDAVELTQADISTYKANIDLARSAIQTEESSLLAQIQLIYSTAISVTSAETSSYNAFLKAEQAYLSAQSDYTTKVSSAQIALQIAQANYNDVIAEVQSTDLASAYADLGIAKAQLTASQARYDKTEIRSPISGVITEIAFDVGELASTGINAVTVQALEDAYKIELNVSESDIVKVSVGDKSEITFDAYTQDTVVEGYVGSIDPAETQIEGVVFYTVEIYVSDTRQIALKPGMSADVTILTDSRTDVLYLPQRPVLENEDGTKYVRVIVGDDYEKRNVITGMYGDGGNIEIISGITQADVVVLSIQ